MLGGSPQVTDLPAGGHSRTLAPQAVQLSDAGKSAHTSQERRNDGKQELFLPSHRKNGVDP